MLLRFLLVALVAAGSTSVPVRLRVSGARARPAKRTASRKPVVPQTDTLPASERLARLIRLQERTGQKVAVAVVSLRGDSLVHSWHAVEPMVPASNLKLLVVAAAWPCWDDTLVAGMRRRLGRRAFLHTQPKISRARTRATRRVPQSPGEDAAGPDTLYLVFPEQDSLSGCPGFDLLCRIGKLSDNHVADALMDCLVKRLGRSRFEVIRDDLAQKGIWSGGLNVEDGSGRSPQNRTTALTLAQTLARFWQAGNRDVFLSCLAVAGGAGTLQRHDLGLGSRVRAKTGSIGGTYSLSGYLSRPDDTLAFSILLNECYDKRSAFEFFTNLLGVL
jgi:D-alanyl-D-alanine carboxypeptidase